MTETAAEGIREAARLTAGLVHIIDDDPAAFSELLSVAGTGRFDHKVAQIRQQRESDKAYDEGVARYVEQGYTVLNDYPTYGDTACVELRYLRTDADEVATEEAITAPRGRHPGRVPGVERVRWQRHPSGWLLLGQRDVGGQDVERGPGAAGRAPGLQAHLDHPRGYTPAPGLMTGPLCGFATLYGFTRK